jgi:antitoxin YefM
VHHVDMVAEVHPGGRQRAYPVHRGVPGVLVGGLPGRQLAWLGQVLAGRVGGVADHQVRAGTGILHQCSTISWYETIGGLNVAITASEARSRLFPLIQQVNDDHEPVRISSRSGDAVLMSADDFDSWQETIYLLRSPANARRLMEAVARDKSGRGDVGKTMEELEDLAGE